MCVVFKLKGNMEKFSDSGGSLILETHPHLAHIWATQKMMWSVPYLAYPKTT